MAPLQFDAPSTVGARYLSPVHVPPPSVPPALGTIIGQFKAAVSRRGKKPLCTPLWQRNFYDHIIRNEQALQEIREYIHNNPMQWDLDRNHPAKF